MAYRIAVASTDGIVVNQHFGHAERFHIIEIDDNNYSFIGTREVERVCQGHYHNDSSFDKVIDVLSDVHAVLVAKIGSGASEQLESRRLTVYEAPFPIEPLIEKIIADRLWEVDEWQYPTKN
ncbi:NifB/NifX family molybdenum-iron cluster-binding protein [Ruminococcus sp.]|uniref:NifB/NifX family molybdenum-iron cluster-binding protein n=1 Tax=Ruminococcus sp. TaxID=41978 RepID=UPI0025F75886|nr:NifB/NifX family molybdenum-iron cluster-binding protein [Ruminococcus sp.]MBQ6252935.1 dinitrogenase iron-molybdenum cofactor biosynthesis protein [Ruminococcus sp.]